MVSDQEKRSLSDPAERVPYLRALVADAREAVRRSSDARAGGVASCHVFSGALDTLIGKLFAVAGAPGVSPPVALLATGGWGRRETCPYSDLDLLFLTPGPPDDPVRDLADRILYPLWDSGLEVGHAVRSLDDALSLVARDLPTATALLDARLVAGDPRLAEELGRGVRRVLAAGGANAFVTRLLEEKRSRHERFGDSLYLLEPNIKHGQGGLRDLATGLWAASIRWPVMDFPDLLPLGQASARQVATLVGARDFLLRVRVAAHLAAGRRQDQLSFELQEAIAPAFFPDARLRDGEVRPVVAPAVEELMRHYYLHTKAALHETDRLLERVLVPPPRVPLVRRLDTSFTVFNGKLSANDPAIFRDRPAEMVRLFRVALEQDLPIYGHTRDVIAEQVAENAGRLAGDRQAHAHLLALLGDPRDRRQPSLLEEMHDLDLLTAIVPELAPTTGRVQHDLYHVYTVDQHQLHAVAHLKRIARGELAREAPAATEALGRVTRPAALYLATLLHDIGKPLGKGHAEKGARLAASIAARLGLEEEDVRRTEFLVRHHLLMSHLSQRRDLDDVRLIASFARTIGDEENLRELYLLTYCDTAMTAPGNLSEWKDTLLRELYERTRAFFRRGPDLGGTERLALVRRRQRRVAEMLGENTAEGPLTRWFAGLPGRYFAANPPKAIARHVRLSRERRDRVAALAVTQHPRLGCSEVVVVAADAPGLLARIAGVLLANRIDIIGARITSRAPSGVGDGGEAVDVFQVRDRYGRPIPAADPRWRRVEGDLERVLSGAEPVERLLESRAERAPLPRRVTPAVPTEIEIDNEVSRDFTVIDVYTHDRLGVLYSITHTLTELGLDIVLSRVATEASRVADVFYVHDHETGHKVVEPARLELIRRSLADALRAREGDS